MEPAIRSGDRTGSYLNKVLDEDILVAEMSTILSANTFEIVVDKEALEL